ncbi:hypothetical protein SAMN05660659_04890 [Pseudomonas sp. LAMO17WK12:I6]|uniref:hypothetical protein n=1 Tax=unclassified Pseudomonas TaxID=196821 RepID=UPI000BCCB448|nr:MULTISPECIES: hypothetical protein [unclassified Pseudomonas]SNY40885.1 hypothetical protein SAMN05660455_04667 [Pseudomonas sp. LAMO17WK12:I5]SNY44750.1 hypothetical protein SAMN05660659_04890 [Pseudomonas sp. LAMO17WK12:I6]
MASRQPLTPAEQSRVDYLKVRRAVTKVPAPVIKVHPDNPFLSDTSDDETNQIPLSQQGKLFKCLVPRPAEAGETKPTPGFIDLTFDGSPIVSTRYNYVTPLDADILEIEMTFPVGYTDRPGTHELGYFIDQGGNESNSEPLECNVDRTPPHPFFPVGLPDEIVNDGITKKYLDDNDFVAIKIPEYGDMKIGDFIELLYGDSTVLAEVVDSVTRTDTINEIVLRLTAEQVFKQDEGTHALFFRVTDRKGNPSTFSPPVPVTVVLTDPPEGLLPLDIPLLDKDGLVDLADAQTPLGVGIYDEYTHYLPGDELVVTYDGIPQMAKPINGFPVYVDISFKDVFKDDPGEKTVDAEYQIKRGSTYYPPTPISKEVKVDMRKPGLPIDPNNPDPTNPNLALVTVQGDSGGPANELREADKDGDVTVTVNTYGGAKEYDTVQLEYAGQLVSEEDGGLVTIPDVIPTSLEWKVKWDVIAAAGNGNPKHPMAYVIGHPLNDNVDISEPREVDVEIQEDTVPDPAFLHLDPNYTDWLNCKALRLDPIEGVVVEVRVPGGELALANQELTFTYQGYTDDGGANPKPETDEEVFYTPTDQEAASGFIVKIPYAPLLATLNAWGGVKYKAVINGRETTSKQHLVRVYLVNPGDGGSCPLPT